MITTKHEFHVGTNPQGEQQLFSSVCNQGEYLKRRQRIESIYNDNCKAAGEDTWSLLGLSFADNVAEGCFPVPYHPSDIVHGADHPAQEYAEMFNAERFRFPSAELFPADQTLYTEGLSSLRAAQPDLISELITQLRMDGVLLEHEIVEICAQKPLTDSGTKTIHYAGKTIRIRGEIQFRLFKRLALDAGRFVDGLTLAEEVWGNPMKTDKAISNTLGHIKQKLETAGITGISFEPGLGKFRMVLS